VGSVVGFGSTCGMVGSVLFSTVIGVVLERSGNYWALFAIGSITYIAAWALIYLILVPRLDRVEL
ncbi:MAG: MFS transporter, partial [Methanobacterium sp.]|nr:MFS transporter [Methanobacterium sp.]